jgi:hypothetical protein
MANRVVKRTDLSHCYDSGYYPGPVTPTEVDKTKAISELSADELRKLISRLRDEREAEDIIRSLRRSAGEKDTYENPAKIDTKTPVDQLYHHGILGQKWGVRRFQKPDGTRTPAGKKRDADREVTKSEDHLKSRENKKKAPEGLSNEELRKLNERLQLEATYKNLTAEKVQKQSPLLKGQFVVVGSKLYRNLVNRSFWEAPNFLLRSFPQALLRRLLTSRKRSKGGLNMNQTVLQHHGILGQKWGVRRFQNPDGSLTPRGQARLDKKDEKWASTKGEKIKKKLQKFVSKDMNEFMRTQLEMSYTSRGKISSSTILQYNNKLAQLMNSKVPDIQAPSGRVLRFVAKRGEIGVHTAVADAGYDLDQLNVVYSRLVKWLISRRIL